MALGTSFTQITKSGLSSTSAYDTGHINSSGIITATKFVGTLEGNVTSDDWTNTATGISTTINVGIGTTNATSKLTVSGTVAATTFSGSIAASNIDSGTLADARIPNLNASKITTGTVATARLGSGTASNTTYLRGDQTWATVSSGPGTGQQYVNIESLGSASNTGNNTFAGYLSGNSLNSADHSTFFGYQAGKAALNAGNNTFFGSNSGLLATGSDNSGFGQGTLETITSATSNVAVGRRALNTTTTSENVAIGADSLRYQSTGSKNVAVGRGAGEHLTSAGDSVAIGFEALRGTNTGNPVTGLQNVAIGAYAGDAMKDGSQNVLIGTNCGTAMVSSHWNVAIGKDCADQATGLGNVILGHDAGRTTSGNYNVVLGKAAGDVGSFSGANNIIIGYNADPTSASTSNEITLGDANITKLRVPGLNFTIAGSAATTNIGSNGVLKAVINNAVSGHQFISQCSDNNNGFEVYQQHGSTSTRNTFAAYDNRGNSNAKQLAFAVVGDGNVKIQDGDLVIGTGGHGIDFGAQSPTSATGATTDGEILDHYERGTWNPGFQTSNSNWSGGVNVSNGNFVRVGKLVYIFGRVSWSSTGGTGNIQIVNLPFSMANGSDYDGQISIGYRENIGYPRLHTSFSTNANRINLHYVDASTPHNSYSVVVGALQSTGHLYFAGCYQAY